MEARDDAHSEADEPAKERHPLHDAVPLGRVGKPQHKDARRQEHYKHQHHEDGVHRRLHIRQTLLRPTDLHPRVLRIISNARRVRAPKRAANVDLERPELLVELDGGGGIVRVEGFLRAEGVYRVLVIAADVEVTAGPGAAARGAVGGEDHVVTVDAGAVEDGVLGVRVVFRLPVAVGGAGGEGYVVACFVELKVSAGAFSGMGSAVRVVGGGWRWGGGAGLRKL